MITDKGSMLRIKPVLGECKYCLKPVGVFGNWIAIMLGTHLHNCDFSNYIGEINDDEL